jgi:hypothetical protein
MFEMLKKVGEFLTEHPELNEVELTDATGLKVRVTRAAPITWVTQPVTWSYWIQPQKQ